MTDRITAEQARDMISLRRKLHEGKSLSREESWKLTDTVIAQAAEIERLTGERDAIHEQVSDMLHDQECACGYDKPTDVCLGHLSFHRKTVARAEAAEARVMVLEGALEFYADKSGWNQPPVQTREGLLSVEYENQASKIQKDRGAIARAALTPETKP